MHRLLYISFVLQLCFTTNTIAQKYNPIPVIFPSLENIYNAQTYGFGQISAVSGSFYVQSAITGNPALIANRNFNRGFLITGPLLLDKLHLVDANFIFSNHPKNYFALHTDYVRFHEVIEEKENNITLNTMSIFQMFTQNIIYGHIVNQNFSWGIGIKFFRPETYSGIIGRHPVLIIENNIFILNLGFNYTKPIYILEKEFVFENGLYISNMGARVDSKIHEDYPKSFLPTKLHFGSLLKYSSEVINKSNLDILLAYQIEKFLVPSPPYVNYTPSGDREITYGKNPDVSFIRGIVQSFYDAPSGFTEEMHEFIHKGGLEIRITSNNMIQLALRIGGVYQHISKSEDSFFTVGVRAGFYGFFIDYSRIPGFSREFSRFNLGYITYIPDYKLRFVD